MPTNPYNKINPLAFPLRKLFDHGDVEVYLFRPDPVSHPGFDVCVFRDHLARFMLDELVDAKMESSELGIMLQVRKGFDAARLREEFNAR